MLKSDMITQRVLPNIFGITVATHAKLLHNPADLWNFAQQPNSSAVCRAALQREKLRMDIPQD